jgi:hypothetical protein
MKAASLLVASAAPAHAFISPAASSSFTSLALPGCIAVQQRGKATLVMQRSEERPLWQQAGAAVALAAASVFATNAGLFSGLGLGPNNAQLQTQQATQSSIPKELPSFAGAARPLVDLAKEENSYIKIFEQVNRAVLIACHVVALDAPSHVEWLADHCIVSWSQHTPAPFNRSTAFRLLCCTVCTTAAARCRAHLEWSTSAPL